MSANALALRIAGHSLSEIADQLGFLDDDAAAEAVRSEISRTAYGRLTEMLAVHLLRLDELTSALKGRNDLADGDRAYAAQLWSRVQRQRAAVLSKCVADALRQADKGEQIGGRE